MHDSISSVSTVLKGNFVTIKVTVEDGMDARKITRIPGLLL
jgi:hypothetical protein